MNEKQYLNIKDKLGIFVAFDQSIKANQYILESYGTKEEDPSLIRAKILDFHKRIIKSKSFNKQTIVGVIINEDYLQEQIDGKYMVDYLWEEKDICSIVRMDSTTYKNEDPDRNLREDSLEEFLDKVRKYNAFGTKIRSTIGKADTKVIAETISSMLGLAEKIYEKSLIPVVEPVVEPNSGTKLEAELILKEELILGLDQVERPIELILRLNLPTRENAYDELVNHPSILRILGLGGGHSIGDASNLVARNPGIDSSFGRAIFQGLNIFMDQGLFDITLRSNLNEAYGESFLF